MLTPQNNMKGMKQQLRETHIALSDAYRMCLFFVFFQIKLVSIETLTRSYCLQSGNSSAT